MLVFIFLCLSVLPTLLYVVMGLPSLTVGLILGILLSTGVLIFLRPKTKVSLHALSFFILLLILVLLHGVVASEELGFKFLGFVVIMAGIVFFAVLFFSALERVSVAIIKKQIRYFVYFLITCGVLSLFYRFDFLGYDKFAKSILIFYEPSHYATVLGTFLLSYLTMCKKKEGAAIILFVFIMGIGFPSVTLILYIVLAVLTIYRSKLTYVMFLFVVAFLALYLSSVNSELSNYFASRILIDQQNDNLSALVYMQGWADALKSLEETNGLGLGYQMAGTNEASEIAERIYDIAGIYKNREGSFIAGKLIIEFGYLGVVLILLYLIYFIKFALSIKTLENLKLKFFVCIYLSFFVEMFVRANALYTFGSVMFLTSVIAIWKINNKRFENNKGELVV